MLRLMGLVRPLIPFMILAVVLGVLGFLAATLIPLLGGYGIAGIAGGREDLPRALFVAAGICAVSRGALRYGEQLCNHYVAFKLLALIRGQVFDALRRLAPAKLEGRDRGNLISIITSDIELLEVFYAHTISPVFIAAVMTLIMTVFIGGYHFSLGLIALAAYITVGAILPLGAARRTKARAEAIRSQLGDLNSYVLESLRGMDAGIQYAAGPDRLAEMNRRSEALSAGNQAVKVSAGRNTARTNTAISLFSLLMLGTVVFLRKNGIITIEGAVNPLIALMSSFGPTAALSNLGAGLQQTIASGNRVLRLMEEEPMVREIRGEAEIAFDGADCRGVTFAYGGEPVLRDISADIPRGSVVGITGKSGSGKSTLLKLFMRFWDPDSGSIRISGRALRQVNTENLRDMESLVTQETSLFHDSIENNIRIGRPGATREEVVAAAKKAAIHDFIQGLPAGYDTSVGELGDRLSGGERQRIGLARAFLHDAPLLLLDEPTSNLDSLNEAVILKALEQERGDKTVVLVSHRRSTMGLAETVYSVEDGRVS